MVTENNKPLDKTLSRKQCLSILEKFMFHMSDDEIAELVLGRFKTSRLQTGQLSIEFHNDSKGEDREKIFAMGKAIREAWNHGV